MRSARLETAGPSCRPCTSTTCSTHKTDATFLLSSIIILKHTGTASPLSKAEKYSSPPAINRNILHWSCSSRTAPRPTPHPRQLAVPPNSILRRATFCRSGKALAKALTSRAFQRRVLFVSAQTSARCGVPPSTDTNAFAVTKYKLFQSDPFLNLVSALQIFRAMNRITAKAVATTVTRGRGTA